MFGKKEEKLERLYRIARIVEQAKDGITQVELSRQLGVSRSTINKDLSIIQEKTGVMLSEDDGRLYWYE